MSDPKVVFVLERDPVTLLAPDISFVRKERVPPPGEHDGFPELAPDLVIECSPRPTRPSRWRNGSRSTWRPAFAPSGS
jgi:Uma2 family endonuclease